MWQCRLLLTPKFLLLVVFVFLVAALTSCTHTPRVSAEELIREYEHNPYQADLKYRDKHIVVEGKILTLGLRSDNVPFVVLDPGPSEYYYGVLCEFPYSERRRVAKLQEGQIVTLGGTVEGGGNIFVIITDCKLK